MRGLLISAAALLAASSWAASITFDEEGLSEGHWLGEQYAAMGVHFVPGISGFAVPNPAITPDGWATNVDMTLVLATGFYVGGAVTPPASGLILHSLLGFELEDGDAAFTINFDAPIAQFALTFTGLHEWTSSAIYAFDDQGNPLGSAHVDPAGGHTQNVSLSNLPGASHIVVVEGNRWDWVGVDNIEFTAVPEPATLVALAGGAALLARRRRS